MKRMLIALVIVTLLLCGFGKKETEETEETQQKIRSANWQALCHRHHSIKEGE